MNNFNPNNLPMSNGRVGVSCPTCGCTVFGRLLKHMNAHAAKESK